METGVSAARQERTHYRHELRTLTYVTLDQANGGIVRNITHEGIGAQLVAAVRPRQQLRVRFELRYPRLRVETRGEVMWATFSGQCGIRFLDLSPRTSRQIDEWIMGNLLEGAELHPEIASQVEPLVSTVRSREDDMNPGSELVEMKFAGTGITGAGNTENEVENDELQKAALTISRTPVKIIELPQRPDPKPAELEFESESADDLAKDRRGELDWLSRPLSGRGLAWTVNSLAVVAALLLFALVFLFVTHELPRWPIRVMAGAAVCMATLYWGFFRLFGGASPGVRLARLAGYDFESEDAPAVSENTERSIDRLTSNG
ncbi:MAG TPA: PilZ domain-containing protein [Verrucomicrobiae bacterium]|jgi:PilZ domain|nr:PilZ domain-containing protein [Verrucomicrobiae bacterium]